MTESISGNFSFLIALLHKNCLYLHPDDMRRLLKYLLLFVVAAAFCGGAGKDVAELSAQDIAAVSFDDQACRADLSPTDSQLNLPRQTSLANTQRVQSSVRRSSGSQRNNVEFAKSGKIVNVTICYLAQIQLLIIHSTLIEPSRRLLCLGKLII
jgi:hypothetical protein